jgi:tetratricopeptide (TPR) repeat protein
MFRKSYLLVIFAAIVPLAVSVTAYAQTSPLAGTVVFQKEGKDEPVAGALVEVYRTDVKGYYKTQTNKKGEFRFIGVLYGDYFIAVSGPNAAPTVLPNVKAGQETLRIVVNPGDGRKYTEAEARQAAAIEQNSGGSKSGGASDEEKAQQAEFAKKNEEIIAKNEKIKNADATAARANTEGQAALKAENYDLAVAKFSEGIAAVPDFVGSTPILINGKMLALKGKGFKLYKEGASAPDMAVRKAKFEEANKAYDEALAGFQDAIAVILRAEASIDPAEQKRRDVLKHDLYAAAAEIHRLKVAGGVDQSKIAEANTVINDYLTLETNAELKASMQMGLGDMMTRAGDFEKAVAAYRQVLVLKPDNAEAMGRLGLALFARGAAMSPEDKEMEQEGLNFMQKYIDMSPVSPTDTPAVKELKVSIKESIDYLKAQKITPQKAPANGGKKKS